MRVALYSPWVHVLGGIERTLLEILRRSRHDVTLYTHWYDSERTYPEFRTFRVVELQPKVSVERSVTPLAGAAKTISRTVLPDADVLLVSSNDLGDLILMRNRIPAVCYCWTPLKILHDPATNAGLRKRDPLKARLLSVLGPALDAVDRRMWRRYRHAFVASDEVRRRVERARLEPNGPLEVLRAGVDLDWFTDDGRTKQDYFLVAGRIKWWKNIELAIAGVAEARARGTDAELVIAGAVDPFGDDYLDSLRSRARGLPVRFEIGVDQERLRELYRSCRALLFPTPNEDFGMVPLEAMACGSPVIAVDNGGPRETVVPGTTGWLVPPTAEGFATAITESRTDGTAERMRRAARARAEEFSWERFVARIDEVVSSLGPLA
jgi:glycosyltransferase involved in cell wall biosynthesis